MRQRNNAETEKKLIHDKQKEMEIKKAAPKDAAKGGCKEKLRITRLLND